MKRLILFCLMCLTIILTSCSQSPDYSVLEEEEIKDLPTVSGYIKELQTNKKEYQGYKIFDSADDKKVVVISSGNGKSVVKVNQVEQSSKDTAITILQTDQASEHENSYVVVQIEEIVGAFYVFERVEYEEAQ
ncbi:hypothetical protein ACSVDE_11740 [Pseudalkalibacillus sp. Hm43]|uniref:hypothetical protein n=1 Tax=Pseudalkalibacillus sp. Hm43 TaxID=3450742 RepID=UPI003F43B438